MSSFIYTYYSLHPNIQLEAAIFHIHWHTYLHAIAEWVQRDLTATDNGMRCSGRVVNLRPWCYCRPTAATQKARI